jgi:hypothetical protein
MSANELDRAQLAALAQVQRRPGLGGAAAAPKDAQSRAVWRVVSTVLKFALFAVLGIAGVAGVLFPSFFLGLTFSYTLIMLIFGLPFLSHCLAVLLDTSENRVLLHLPISGRTLLAARFLALAKYAGFIALSTSLPTAVALALRFGIAPVIFFVFTILLTILLVVAVALAACMLAMRHVKPARAGEAILWFQTVLFFLAIYAATFVLNEDLPLADMVRELEGKAYWHFFPPAWMAGLLDFAVMEPTQFNGILAATAVLVPVLVFTGCLRWFSGGRFMALLARLEAVPVSRRVSGRGLRRWIAGLSALMRDPQERAAFDLTSKLMKKDSTFKRQTLPSIAGVLVNAGLITAKFRHGPLPDLTVIAFCYPLMLVAFIGPLIQYSPQWRAAWCYQVLPFASPGVIVAAATQAFITRFILPACLLLLIVAGVVWGASVAWDMLFASGAIILVCAQRFWSAAPAYSREPALLAQKGRMAGRLVAFPLALALIALHVALDAAAGEWGVAAGVVALGGAIAVAFRRLRLRDSPEPLPGSLAPAQAAIDEA